MTNAIHIIAASPISTCANARAALLANALADNARDLTAAEQTKFTGYATAILHETPTTPTDAAIQLETATEAVELSVDGVGDFVLSDVGRTLRACLPIVCKAVGYEPIVFPTLVG